MSEARNPRPEAEQPDEALLWSAWAADLSPDDAPDLDEEILGLLDGTSRGESAARARARLAADPRLARAFGELVEAARSVETVPRVAAPGRRIAEARELVGEGNEVPRRGRFSFLRDLFSSPTPAVLAAATAVLLVVVVLRAPTPERPQLRAEGAAPRTLEVLSPAHDARIRGDVRFAWRPVPEVHTDRIVLMDASGGTIDDLGSTEATRLFVPAADLVERFGGEPRTLHWIVRARLDDGSEIASSPARLDWSAD
jgi:hypothetical protein